MVVPRIKKILKGKRDCFRSLKLSKRGTSHHGRRTLSLSVRVLIKSKSIYREAEA
jgi:hypothetical protein